MYLHSLYRLVITCVCLHQEIPFLTAYYRNFCLLLLFTKDQQNRMSTIKTSKKFCKKKLRRTFESTEALSHIGYLRSNQQLSLTHISKPNFQLLTQFNSNQIESVTGVSYVSSCGSNKVGWCTISYAHTCERM